MAEHTAGDKILPASDSPEARRRRVWREGKDRLLKYSVGFGGITIIVAIALIFFYLLYVVLPLFKGTSLTEVASYQTDQMDSAYLVLNEYNDMALSVGRSGQLHFFSAHTGEPVTQFTVPTHGRSITSISAAGPSGIIAYGFDDGSALVVEPRFSVTYPEDSHRKIVPELLFPLGEAPISLDSESKALTTLIAEVMSDKIMFAGLTDDNRLLLQSVQKQISPTDNQTVSFAATASAIRLPEQRIISHMRLNREQQLYVTDTTGTLYYYDVQHLDKPRLIQQINIVPPDVQITSLEFLTGGISLLVGRSDGQIDQWFPVRTQDNGQQLHNVRSFQQQSAAIVAIAAEQARKGFLALDESGQLGIYHTTAHRTLLIKPFLDALPAVMGLSSRADGVIGLTNNGAAKLMHIENDHPEVSWHVLWGKVWYESRDEADYIWQSSSASSDFEPKFSLMPLTFGTIKAAFYAMLVAIPLAIMGAIYTAYFMSPRMRALVKPTIEIMEALPTVILGFLAGLWLAPLVESHLPGIFTILIGLPIVVILIAWGWTKLPRVWLQRIPDGWEAVILIPVVVLTAIVALHVSAILETWLFGGNMPQYLNELGLDYDQRNSLVVGLAMGFAVIPTIFSITEEAVFGVPKHLTIGSLALGASPWQTMTRVVLLTASPGIFSAVMIGLGRAVGETMIVLMATGNTPIMDFNIFEGFRALSANIAVEIPEAEVASSHYRILFLAALLLFVATFLLNTLAEIVRQRLRKKYSML